MESQGPEDLSLGGSIKRKAEDAAFNSAIDDNKRKVIEDGVVAAVSKIVVVEKSEDKKPEPFRSFDGFKVDSVLSNSADYKRIVVEGTAKEGKAVIILERKPFTEETLPALFSKGSSLSHTFQNDIYGSYDCVLESKLAAVKTTIVYPATQKHIDKYRVQPFYMVEETPDIYEKVTLPYLNSSSFDIKWVFNILNHEKEADRIVFEDPDPKTGFILLPDLKWDGVNVENLYLCAIVRQEGIKSLRDLNGSNISLLENVLKEGSDAIEKKYGLKKSQLRIYIHYQPSYYHLHLHFTALSFNAPGISAEKAHLLQSVIDNLRHNPLHYQLATLPFTVKQGDRLHSSLVEYGYKF